MIAARAWASMRRLMFPQRKFYRYFVSVAILLLICAGLQFLSINFIRFSSGNSALYRKTSVPERTRGVREQDRPLYVLEDGRSFMCRDGSAVIRPNQVNDDYCDCQTDGSDEPGTEACPSGRFFCLPEERYIPSSRVNDGICDCCDGSDEWKANSPLQAVGNVRSSPCEDTCREIYKLLEEKRELRRKGAEAKQEYLDAGRLYIGHKDDLYGKQGEFYLLSIECFYLKREKTLYTLCPFKQSTQESAGKSYLLGEGGGWIQDPRTGDDVLVMNGGERSRCPQGKKRRTMVYFVCGLENKIHSITEDEVCVYGFHMSTPAVC